MKLIKKIILKIFLVKKLKINLKKYGLQNLSYLIYSKKINLYSQVQLFQKILVLMVQE